MDPNNPLDCGRPDCEHCSKRTPMNKLPCLWVTNPEAAMRDYMRTVQEERKNRRMIAKLILWCGAAAVIIQIICFILS